MTDHDDHEIATVPLKTPLFAEIAPEGEPFTRREVEWGEYCLDCDEVVA